MLAGAVTVDYGLLTNASISFLAVVLAMFLVVKGLNGLSRANNLSGKPK